MGGGEMGTMAYAPRPQVWGGRVKEREACEDGGQPKRQTASPSAHFAFRRGSPSQRGEDANPQSAVFFFFIFFFFLFACDAFGSEAARGQRWQPVFSKRRPGRCWGQGTGAGISAKRTRNVPDGNARAGEGQKTTIAGRFRCSRLAMDAAKGGHRGERIMMEERRRQ